MFVYVVNFCFCDLHVGVLIISNPKYYMYHQLHVGVLIIKYHADHHHKLPGLNNTISNPKCHKKHVHQ
jgi:hypothetical protein